MKKIAVLLAILAFGWRSNAQFTLSCDSFCVLNISLDAQQSGVMLVEIFNGNSWFITYPTVTVLDASGDTVGTDNGQLYFFVQLGNTTITHKVYTTLDTLLPGFTGTVLFSDNLWDTTCILPYPCGVPTGVPVADQHRVTIFPNPAGQQLTINLPDAYACNEIQITDGSGRILIEQKISSGNQLIIDVSILPPGFYFLRDERNRFAGKFMKE